ncbi:hypothetical protein VTO42DRAFT_3139 [Malbranchea cinnamomea]
MTDIGNAPPGQELSSISEVVNGDEAHAQTENKPQKGSGPDIPPPKTDKPRPHVCTTCTRSFARLEHLKRHERSHTKEKPFECPECTRCFARRDLLLRHQQKLHMTTTPSSRPRNVRRESTSSSRVRKNSIAGGSAASMRPRANTISHVGGGTVGMLAGSNNRNPASKPAVGHGHSHHPSLSGIPIANLDLRSMGADGRLHHNTSSSAGLTKLNTSGISIDISESLRTAPVFGSFDASFGLGDFLLGSGSTINPAQLHFSGSPNNVFADTPTSPFHPPFSGMSTTNANSNNSSTATTTNTNNNNNNNNHHAPEEDTGFDWMTGFEHTMTFTNESAIDGSSPSAMSTGSQSGISEAIIDGTGKAMTSAGQWQGAMMTHAQSLPNTLSFDFPGSIFPLDTVSPKSLVTQSQLNETSFVTPSPQTPMGTAVSGAENLFSSHTSSAPGNVSAGPIESFGQNYFPPQQPDYLSSITESTRQSLMATLRQPSGFNHRRYSQPSSKPSVTSPGAFSRPSNYLDTNSYTLPSTSDLQRYIAAYVSYFHPHMPFLHIPTLNFNAPEYSSGSNRKATGGLGNTSSSSSSSSHVIAGGGGCLILSMAAIGALFEFETATSKELFDCAKKMIQLYLEERRKADMSAALNRSNSGRDSSVQSTPLWLVQAMLLNVIYGFNCDDKTAADIASTHCAALVSLARAAELTVPHPPAESTSDHVNFTTNGDIHMDETEPSSWSSSSSQARKDWLNWKSAEERKRTLYSIFMLSSFLVSAYNHAPALTNSEIRLTLPCDEQLWAAESPQAWMALGGRVNMEQYSVKFADALKVLLVASQQSQHGQFGTRAQNDSLSIENLKPSAFGCMVLINALHNYIWETRQQYMGKQWTNQETEAMHVHIEPALRAWQAVWSSNPHHRVERPNPFGLGPLSADSIPLLDLAYIRLYVSLGRCKEAFWQRDWDGMAEELSRAAEGAPHVDGSSDFGISHHGETGNLAQESSVDYGLQDLSLSTPTTEHAPPRTRVRPSKNERHLRKAAFYAADSLCMSDKFGNTYAELTSRELPVQFAMCIFDCSMVLAEWVATIQDRIGPYVGILGQDPMDLSQVPAIMLLEDEDYALMQKIDEFLAGVEAKMKENMSHFGSPGDEAYNCLPSLVDGGYSTKILFAAAHLLSRAGVWKIMKLSAQALEYHGVRMRQRAQRSVSAVMS